MKRWALLCAVTLLFAGAAAAQDDDSKVEVFGGYSYVRVNPGFGAPGLNFNGGSGSIAYKVFPMISLVGDFGGYHWGGSGDFSGEDATAVSYMFGPKASFHAGPITPFVQTLFGGTHISGSGCDDCCDTRVRAGRAGVRSEGDGCGESFFGSDNAFSLTVGGGLDWNATPHIGVRLIQAEYYMTRFESNTQNNARISAGVTFRF
jgi:opacity protein-like surface antigen